MSAIPQLSRTRLEDHLDFINQHDEIIQAWQTLFPEAARAQADALDQRGTGESSAPLQGLFVGIKDIFDFTGYSPGNGLPFALGSPAEQDATVVRKLKKAGAVILGTTRLTEYCYYRATTTTNPHNTQHTPGGSSSGSAAAVAAGMADIAIGTQTVGSTIRPASFCGVYGFKPTFGAISLQGAAALSYSMDHVGLFARRLADLSALFEVLKGYDPSDFRSRPIPGSMGTEETRNRVGVIEPGGTLEFESAQETAIAQRMDQMRGNGWEVHPVSLTFELEEVKQIANTLLSVETSQILRDIADTPYFEKFGEDVRGLVENGQRSSLDTYFGAMKRRLEMRQQVAALFSDYEFLILPSALGAAPKGLSYTGDPICTVLTSLTGLPAINIPVGVNNEGLPLGMQVIGAPYTDSNLLERARLFADGDLAPAKSDGWLSAS